MGSSSSAILSAPYEIAEEDESEEESDEETMSAVDPSQYKLPFTNLVMCGGGVKGFAHFGAAQYLEEIGVLPNIKRFAGTSVGALFASLYASGMTYQDMLEFYTIDLERLVYDGSWIYFFSNLLNRYGWHPMNRLVNLINEMFQKKTGINNITFSQLYRKTGNELCVVVCNLSNMSVEYFHPKTTPDFPVATAVRMSMTIPGLFTSKEREFGREIHHYIDGSFICNFPLHCFDGWYLSMEKEDNFFDRLNMTDSSELARAFNNRFKSDDVNLKTLGLNFHVADEEEEETGSRTRTKEKPRKPKKNTRLYRTMRQVESKDRQAIKLHNQLNKATSVFMHVLSKQVGQTNVFSRDDLKRAYNDELFYPVHAQVLFGDRSVTEVCDHLDFHNDDRIPINALLCFFESRDVGLFEVTRFPEKRIDSVGSFLSQVTMTVFRGTFLRFFKPRDHRRTVWINTGHVSALDFGLEQDDRDFLRQRGYNACKSFLQKFVTEEKMELKGDNSNLAKEDDFTYGDAKVEEEVAQAKDIAEEN